jgi:hypothetical protein
MMQQHVDVTALSAAIMFALLFVATATWGIAQSDQDKDGTPSGIMCFVTGLLAIAYLVDAFSNHG